MTVVVIGATPANAERIERAAAARGVRVAIDSRARRSDWAIVATAEQRHEARGRYGLPAFRVIELPEIAADGTLDENALSTGIARIAELGGYRPALSPFAVRVTRWVMPRIMAALERALGTDAPDLDQALTVKAEKSAEKAVEKAARLRERTPKLDTPEEARRRAERKAERKAARRVENSLAGNSTGLRRSQ